MLIAIRQIYELIEEENKLKDKLNGIEGEIKSGQVGFIKGLLKKKEDIIVENEKRKEVTQQKINDIGVIIRILGDNIENQIEEYKKEKTKSYYKCLKIFAILQRESNKVVRELWTLVKNALNDISPNAGQDEEYQAQPMTEQLENQESGGEAPESSE